jgi:hypothetical protein
MTRRYLYSIAAFVLGITATVATRVSIRDAIGRVRPIASIATTQKRAQGRWVRRAPARYGPGYNSPTSDY